MLSKRYFISVISIFIIIVVWQLISRLVNAEIILPNPLLVLYSLAKIVYTKGFLLSLISTLYRGILGFFISFILGIVVGIMAGISYKFRAFISPLITTIRSTPVISVILLALIWFNVNNVPIFVAFLMAFPIVCGNIIEGITTVDKNLLEMANTYNILLRYQVYKIYIPSIVPFIISGASTSLGVVWKVIIAAEVLSQPKWGIGTSLNEAKSFLLTEEVFAWTVVAIFLSGITEFLFNKMWKLIPWRNN